MNYSRIAKSARDVRPGELLEPHGINDPPEHVRKVLVENERTFIKTTSGSRTYQSDTSVVVYVPIHPKAN